MEAMAASFALIPWLWLASLVSLILVFASGYGTAKSLTGSSAIEALLYMTFTGFLWATFVVLTFTAFIVSVLYLIIG